MTDLIPQFGGIAFTIIAFVVALSIIVAIHEYGHYIVGRWSGIHAEVFSLGFGPVLASRVDKHGTKWQFAALPFGGYVKFLGDADAASGKDAVAIDALDAQERRRSMHGAPLWARAATVAAGPIFNFILSILIFAAVLLFSGQASEAPRVGEIRPMPAEMAVLEQGDEITAIAGEPVADLSDVFELGRTLEPAATLTYDILRGGEAMQVEASFPLIPAIGSVTPRSAAMDAGLREGDVIRQIDGETVHAFSQLREAVENSEGAELSLSVWRDGEMLDITLAPRRMDLPSPDGGFETRWLMGVTGGLFFDPEVERVGFGEALMRGVTTVGYVIETSLSGLWHMITGAISSCNLQGPIGIAETSGAAASQGLDSFFWFIAVLSTAVGLLNLFPIPVLDGGHLLFHAFEAVAGRPPSDKALRIFMTVGLTLILGLMLFALTNDLFCP
ncbi:RIP metalloprotease RseP [Alterinioella nitratireducens]|uniref:RIP metalloprotease RseP n=1 Tax=Alterinioella nitratireducens TaxID=2735915 RepID=UPI0015579E19|nr:RIP metalloprotease RseP [Alterinioella nitratireducens]NPD19105.1 RIP metalloprotease RseP [Alterinioella nitratireducens]